MIVGFYRMKRNYRILEVEIHSFLFQIFSVIILIITFPFSECGNSKNEWHINTRNRATYDLCTATKENLNISGNTHKYSWFSQSQNVHNRNDKRHTTRNTYDLIIYAIPFEMIWMPFLSFFLFLGMRQIISLCSITHATYIAFEMYNKCNIISFSLSTAPL